MQYKQKYGNNAKSKSIPEEEKWTLEDRKELHAYAKAARTSASFFMFK
jgi:hypothetical protein